ncbi:MAG: hypothetical protein MZU84_02295 [Sphingobacterium sp.]|nr:hypothetical protein [Sphingobacterium sp.]
MNGKRTSLAWLLCLGLFHAAFGQTEKTLPSISIPLEEMLNEDGSLDLEKDFRELDPKGWRMMRDAKGAPRFVRESELHKIRKVGKGYAGGPLAGDEKWDGRFAFPGPGVDGVVYAMAVMDNQLFIGGSFSSVCGVTVKNIAKWDGHQWTGLPVGGGVNGPVRVLAAHNGTLYVGGEFTRLGGDFIRRVNGIAIWRKMAGVVSLA